MWNVRRHVPATAALIPLVLANLGTTTAEFAGLAAGFQLFGVSKYIAVPVAAVTVSWLVLAGRFHRIEHLLTALSAVFICYIAAGLLAHPDWGAALHGLVVPTLPMTRDAVFLTTATVGTTLAPWGLAFIQSYAVDKHLVPADLRLERIDVILVRAIPQEIRDDTVIILTSAPAVRRSRTSPDIRSRPSSLRA